VKRATRQGYSLVEVMMAVAVMTIGATGILAMQQAATRGNLEARQLTTATIVVETWLERLKREASLYWTTQVPAVASLPSRALNLRQAVVGVAPWFSPSPAVGSTESYAFDFWGRDTTINANQTYCAQARMQWVYVGSTMRADVRVWWHRRGSGDVTQHDARVYRTPLCGAGSEDAMTGDPRLKFVYGSTLLRWSAPSVAVP
jgi:type IV pilus assembly protein PilV